MISLFKSKDRNNLEKIDLFIFAAENSADLHGSNIIKELLSINPSLKISAVSGPLMREEKIDVIMEMEKFHVMGFIDVLLSIFKLIKNFFFLRKKILKLNPKACLFIDYPDFNLRLQKSLKKKGYKNRLIHFISPSIWAWRENRKYFMEKYLDILITIFPFEKKYFSTTKLDVRYVSHPLFYKLKEIQTNPKENLVAIFPGSRSSEIKKNLPLQLNVAKRLLQDNENLKFLISNSRPELILPILNTLNLSKRSFELFSFKSNYEVMSKAALAIATSGTITLELGFHKVPTIVTFAISYLDLVLATKILKIKLPFYSIVNIIMQKEVFIELFGPNFTFDNLYNSCKRLLFNEEAKRNAILGCEELKKSFEAIDSNKLSAKIILDNLKS